jgi:hypothetical protein
MRADLLQTWSQAIVQHFGTVTKTATGVVTLKENVLAVLRNMFTLLSIKCRNMNTTAA